jgi:transposase InsO family protein
MTFGTVLLWSVYGDDSLAERIDRAIDILWTGFAPREPVTSHVTSGAAKSEFSRRSECGSGL